MASESFNAPRSVDGAGPREDGRRRLVLLVAAVVAGLAGAACAWVGAKLFLRGVRTARIAARFAYRVATFGLYRRCPDCRRLIRADARVCAYCGYRKPVRAPRGRRARRRAKRARRDQVVAAA